MHENFACYVSSGPKHAVHFDSPHLSQLQLIALHSFFNANCKMYLFKLQNVFIQVAKCIHQHCNFSQLQQHSCTVTKTQICNVFITPLWKKIAKCICWNCKMYLSKLHCTAQLSQNTNMQSLYRASFNALHLLKHCLENWGSGHTMIVDTQHIHINTKLACFKHSISVHSQSHPQQL